MLKRQNYKKEDNISTGIQFRGATAVWAKELSLIGIQTKNQALDKAYCLVSPTKAIANNDSIFCTKGNKLWTKG